MDAIVTAGGKPKPGEPLYRFTQGKYKALLDVAGKPMIQWVLDALSGSRLVERVVVIGLPPDSGLSCALPITYYESTGDIVSNTVNGIRYTLQINPTADLVLSLSSDLPAITPQMVDWLIEAAGQSEHDFYYPVVTRQAMEGRFPTSNRTYLRLRDGDYCGGDMMCLRTELIRHEDPLWERLADARKSPLRQAALLGFDTLLLIALHLVTLEQAANKISKRLRIRGRALPSPYPEVAMDVDKPHQLEIVRSDLARQG